MAQATKHMVIVIMAITQELEQVGEDQLMETNLMDIPITVVDLGVPIGLTAITVVMVLAQATAGNKI